jgi:DNA-binding CsgD family transcriptional regulator
MLILNNPKFTLDAISNPASVENFQGALTHCNESFLVFVGKTLDQVIGNTTNNLFNKELSDILTDSNKNLLSTKKRHLQYEIQCPYCAHQDTIKVSKSLIMARDGAPSGFITLFSNHQHVHNKSARVTFALTPQEDNILRGLYAGLPIKSIAKSLNISPHTVYGYLKSIYLKMGVNSRAEAQAMTTNLLGGTHCLWTELASQI